MISKYWDRQYEIWVQSDVLSVLRGAPFNRDFMRKYNFDFW